MISHSSRAHLRKIHFPEMRPKNKKTSCLEKNKTGCLNAVCTAYMQIVLLPSLKKAQLFLTEPREPKAQARYP